MKKMMKALLLLTLTVLMAAALSACAGSSQFVGRWTLVVDKTAMPSMTEEEASATDAYLSTLSFTLTIKGDGTATASGSFIQAGQASSATANWTENGNTLTLKDPSGASSDKDMVLTLKDGKLYFDESVMGTSAAYFYLQKR